ncbi:RipA family octameric membrane protein [Puniceicoccus vermicola]|uniref:Uncharacterized protein n=1 Tax=Puniceicoccus vermicola TaxID=388746 RepID=A0A7X1B0Y6_9BACT|nr:hypothetical protein [Puniceicoccus vermicola]MBC2603552.1 hypothetical protein [Puniceicoccus vermicola]
MKQNENTERRFRIALDCRNSEIDLFWRRSSHYWLFVGASLVAYGALKSQGAGYAFVVASFGLVSSAAWMVSTVGSKWWIENWEKKLRKEAEGLDIQDLFIPEQSIGERSGFIDCLVPITRYSPSRPAVLVAIFSTILWAVIFFSEAFWGADLLEDSVGSLSPNSKICIAIFTGLAVFLFFFFRGKDPRWVEQNDTDNPVNSPGNPKNHKED